jgi:hypothetical protein
VPESRASGGDAIAGDDHLAAIQVEFGVPGPEGRRQPPGRRGAHSVLFDAFEDEQGRQAHLTGQIAAALGEAAQTRLSVPPVIVSVDLLGAKVS